jgi:nitrate/nitrite transporter NarK
MYALRRDIPVHRQLRPARGLDAAPAVFVCAMLSLGMGNGAVFQLVPQRFRQAKSA